MATLALLILLGFKQTALWPKDIAKAPEGSKTLPAPPGFNMTQFSTIEPSSPWVIVNKQHAINPTSYVPDDLVVPNVPLRLSVANEQMHIRKLVEEPVKRMFADAITAGFSLSFGSGYRSFNYQKSLYNGYVNSQGQTEADRTSARPGYSEHQTGLAFDVEATGGKCHLDKCLGEMGDGKWLAANAYKYGFIVRYTAGKEDITGYDYEPWHLRYVGIELATEMYKKNTQTLEEFFSVNGGKNY